MLSAAGIGEGCGLRDALLRFLLAFLSLLGPFIGGESWGWLHKMSEKAF